MKYCAQLNGEGICIGVITINGEINNPALIEIPQIDGYMWHKHENGVWSEETYEPETSTPQPTVEDQLATLQEQNLILMDAMATTFEEVLRLQEQIAALQGGTV